MKSFKELNEAAPKMRSSTNPVEQVIKGIKDGLFGFNVTESKGKFTISGFENGGKVKITVSGDTRAIFTDKK